MDYKLTARRWLSAFVVAAILAPAAYARQSPYDGHTFYTKLAPQAGDPPGDIKVLCVGTTLDLNCDGIVNLQDAILYADLCAVAAEGKGEGLLHSADTLQMRCRKAIGVADAFAALNNRPDLFESDGKSWLLMPSCGAAGGTPSEQLAAQAASSNEILCSGMATISAAIVQHVAGVLPNIPTDPNTVPPLPTNRPGNPDVYTPPTAEPPILTTPLPKVDPGQTFTPSPTPCTVPTPERSVMPGGDSPNVCCGELHFDGTNPCNIPVEVPSGLEGPGHSDEIICVSSTGTCQPPTPSTDPSNPTDTDVSDPFYCASANPCVPTCDDMPCSEGPFKSPATPGTICAGTCHFPYVDLDGDSDKPDDSWKLHDDGIYRYTPEFKPKEKKPTIYCGDLESSGTQSTLSANESGEDPKSCQPVDLVSGHKIEQETDLTVSLVGRDFSVIRNYSSNPHDLGVTSSGTFATGWGAFGFGWSSPLFEQMLVDGDDLVLMGARPNSFTRFERAGTEWRTAGPTQDVITSGTAPDRQGNPVDVYRVVSPGAGETLFYRTGSLAGRLLFERDEYGNARWFEYRWFGTGTPVFPRLYRVYLNGAGLDDAQALIEFGYTVFEQGVTPDDALAGRISRVVCFRFTETSGSRTAIETHRIDYTYKRSGDGLSDDCGTPGDLIQVTKFSRVDVGSPRRLVSNGRRYGPDYEYRTSVTQYRYHRAVQPDTGNERLDVVGGLHCLKSVFRSTQLEYYAELLNRNNAWLSGTAMSVRDAAQRLMLLPDSSLAVTRDNEQYHVYELASKIVGYSGTAIGDGNKVAVEYLQTGGCGCGGAVQSVRQEFERFAWTSADGHAGRTTAITESYRSEGTTPTWTPFRRRRVDSQRIGTSTAFYGVNSVLEALDPSGTPGRRWLTHYTYDPNTRTLGEVWTPSACRDLSYTSAGPGSAPTLTGSAASDGLINYYLYNSDKRLIEAGVRNAGGGSNTPVVTIGYDATRTHLPIQIEEIADTSGGANGKQTTTFQYTFYTGVYPNAVQSVRTIVEAERPEENGPSGAGVAYSTLTLLDQQGQAVWRAAADGALTRRDYDPRTGRVSGVVANADPAGLGALSGLYSDWASTYGLSTIYAGPTLSYTLERDEQGRITRTISPGPDGPVSQEWVFGYRRIDEPGLNERSGIPYAFYGILPPTWSGSTSGSAGPITLVWTNVGGGTVQAGRFETVASAPLDRADIPALLTATPGSDPLAGYLGDEAYRQLMRFSLSNQVVSATAWHDIGGHLGRPQDDRSYTASCEYDAIGRRVKVVSTTGDISKFDHESATGRVIAEYHGTADNNLQLVSSYYYDSGGTTTQGVGNGNLTLTVLQTGETSPNDTRSRKYAYDFRDRLQSIQNPLPPHQFFVYDNLGRITESADFTGSAPTAIDSPGRGSYARQYFSQRGLPYRSAVAINPSDLGAGFIESHRWFDSVGRAIASTGPDSPTLKVRYDRLGRVSIGFVTDRGGDAAPGSGSYADAASLAGDTVLEQTEYQYTDADYLSFVRHLVHPHDAATGQGRLAHPDDPACGESTGPGIATYTGYRYDGAGRLVRTVEFGTNKAPAEGLAGHISLCIQCSSLKSFLPL